MTTYRTGADAEHLAAMRLVRLGYVVHLASHRGEQRDGVRIPYGSDLVRVATAGGKARGLFDLVALGADDTRWVQVKAVRDFAGPPAWWRRAVEALPASAVASYELWLLCERPDGWRVWRRRAGAWAEEVEGC